MLQMSLIVEVKVTKIRLAIQFFVCFWSYSLVYVH